MKKQLFSPITTLCLSGLLLATSCGKDKDDDNNNVTPEKTTYEKLLGSWNVTAYADDDNRNGMIEESEKYPIDSTETNTLIFEKGDRYTYVYEDLTDPSFNETDVTKWILSNDKEMLIIDGDSINADTAVAIIHTLTDSDLIIYSKEDPYTDWVIMKRK